MPNRDQAKADETLTGALVRDESGEQRVEAILPFGVTDETFWTEAFQAAVKNLAAEVFRRGDHGRSEEELEQSILAHLNRDAMASVLAQEYLSALTREVRTYLEVDLHMKLGRVEASASGFIRVICLTLDIASAGKVFNCMVSIDRTGRLESLRAHTAVMRNWEWGLLLASFIQCIDRVCKKRSNVHARLFREICKNTDLVRRALIEGLDQPHLTRAVYGAFSGMDRSTSSIH